MSFVWFFVFESLISRIIEVVFDSQAVLLDNISVRGGLSNSRLAFLGTIYVFTREQEKEYLT